MFDLESKTGSAKANAFVRDSDSLSLASILHCVAACIFLLYAASHIGFLMMIKDEAIGMRNLVFPSLTNGALYLVVAIIELAIGIACLRNRGQHIVSLMILTFIAILLWYRWAFFLNGGSNCNCLGLLGKLLRINRFQEKSIPIITMTILGVTASPWLFTFFKQKSRALFRTVLLALTLLPHLGLADEIIEIRGLLKSGNYNPHTGEIHLNTSAHSTFLATVCGPAWSICVTNLEHEAAWWTQRFSDGTNTYVLRPSGGSFWHTNPPQSNLNVATIAPSAAAATFDADPFGAALVSITYGLSPHSFSTNKVGILELPLPWTVVRDNPDAFGFKWVIQASPDERFLQTFSVFRETAVDLPDPEELLRPQIDYPETLAEYEAFMRALRYRKATPQGYLRGKYECTEWYRTNDWVIPKATILKVYLPPDDGNFPARIFSLEATNVTMYAGNAPLMPAIAHDTTVADYRYKRANQTRIFKYAEYTLKAGDSWRPANDPALLALADDWLTHGRKYTHFAGSGKRWGAWLVLALLLAPLSTMLLNRLKQPKKQ
jgi:hypothetical protein